MGFRHQVKHVLRMCGHAVVSTVHERLDNLERQVNDLGVQNASLAETQTALLQAAISVVESVRQVEAACRGQEEKLRGQAGRFEELRAEVASLGASMRASEAALLAEEDLLRLVCVQQTEELRTQQAILATLGTLPPRVFLETNDYEFLNPEIGLMSALYSRLPTRGAVDAGAHIGDTSERLLTAGYEVHAFEPNPAVFEKLTQRLGGRQGFHPFRLALGPGEAEMPLHLAEDTSGSGYYEDVTLLSSLVSHSLPEGLFYTSTVPVSVRSLAGLHRSGAVPEDVSLVKIDTEGYDLDVIRGMDDYNYPVVVAEFWDPQFPFGRSGVPYTLESLTDEMRQRGYPYYIVLYRLWGQDQSAYYCNRGRSVPNSWGNVFFFRDYTVFSHGQAWCSAVLPATYFKPMSSH